MKARIYLRNHNANFTQGHPWIYPKAILSMDKEVQAGELVSIHSENKDFLGLGVFNPHSLYRVRVLARAFEFSQDTNLAAIIRLRLKQAAQLRQALQLPNATTTAFRLFNSEADGLSGLTIDYFDNTYVVSSSAYWVEANKKLIQELMKEVNAADLILWRAQKKPLMQDGWTIGDENLSPAEHRQILEAGLRFDVQFDSGQKTGLFLDQRENHQRIGQLAAGKKVLDLYTYTGGFALHAARGGATRVTAVDSSAPAIAQAMLNAQLNALTIEFIEADARKYLQHASEYDLIILDPPKLIPSRTHLNQAKNYYRFLHRELFKAMQTGSLLMSCNCSSALSASDFCQLISQQALAVNKQVRIIGQFGPAGCHPTLAAFPEGNYLTAVLVALL